MRNQFFLILLFTVTPLGYAQAQPISNSPEKSYVSISLPRTPESSSIEKYGNIPVNEYSGTPSISIPIYSLKSKFIEVPVSISYNATGIKVNQEATCVGLGFDLNAGGRITVETKGNVDELVRNSITSSAQFKDGFRRLINKFTPIVDPNPYSARVGYAHIDYALALGLYDQVYHRGDTAWDDPFTISRSAWEGAGEPDIYHANFLGQSFKFYIDILTDEVRFIGESTNFKIEILRNQSTDKIGGIKIIDNKGVVYYFEQSEISRTTMPTAYGQYWTTESVTAWLLTRIQNMDDQVLFTYSNFGEIYPAYTWSQSYTGSMPTVINNPSDSRQNQIIQYPYYLSKVENNSGALVFSYSTRIDIQGSGARRLDSLKVFDKTENKNIQNFKFEYDYFLASARQSDASLPDYQKKRLKLLSFYKEGAPEVKWKFFYKNIAGPNKFSFAQDHWGYFNGVLGQSNTSLIPSYSYLGGLADRNIRNFIFRDGNNTSGSFLTIDESTGNTTLPLTFQGNANRNCDPGSMLVYLLDSICYPTGGNSKYEFEPHVSNYLGKGVSNLSGGGIRIKSINHYSSPGTVASRITYDYQNSGIYLGSIEYLTVSTCWPIGNRVSISAWGVQNENELLVGYTDVKVILFDAENQNNNGYARKYFSLNNPVYNALSTVGSPYSICHFLYGGQQCIKPALSQFLFLNYQSNPPLSRHELDGKLLKEEIYSSADQLIKKDIYYYRQANFSSKLYSLRVEDNYDGHGYLYSINHVAYPTGEGDFGTGDLNRMQWRRWKVYMFPAVSFSTVLDSAVSISYNSLQSILTKRSYLYNSFNQVSLESIYNSDETVQNTYFKWPTDYPLLYNTIRYFPSGDIGDATLVSAMWNNHIYDLPIEQVSARKIGNVERVIGGKYVSYDKALVKKNYNLESSVSLVMNNNFALSKIENYFPVGGGYDINKNSKYVARQDLTYSASNLVENIKGVNENLAYIWNGTSGVLLAAVTNASSSEIYCSSFEEGGWDADMSYDNSKAHTGRYAGRIDKASAGERMSFSNQWLTISLTAPTKFRYSGWVYSNGPGAEIFLYMKRAGEMGYFSYVDSRLTTETNKWVYIEGEYTVPADVTQLNIRLDNNGGGTVWFDDIRLHPSAAQMTTYTYDPLIGMTSQSDVDNRVTYYSYDGFGRLSLILDQDKNILKRFCYNYAGQPEACGYYFNVAKSQNFTRDNCGAGYLGGTVTYTVPANRYGSGVSQTDADNQALAEINSNGQSYANANGTCTQLAIYARMEFTDYFNDIDASYANAWIRFYSDAACTVPVSVSNLTVNYKRDKIFCSGGTITTGYSALCSGTQFGLGQEMMSRDDGIHCEDYYFYVTAGTGYTAR